MTTLTKRGSGTPTTTGTTWATVTNAVDGTVGTNPATYATYTNAVASAVATITVTGYFFSTPINALDTLNSVTVSLRHFENNTGRFASVRFQAFDGATAIGSEFTATMATAARTDSTTFPVTLAQVRSSTFKIVVTITGAASTQSRVFSIDQVDVTADWTPAPPAITQAAYRFYADGTESGSTALAAQDTAHTVDTSGGDVSLQLRVRLQSTNGVATGPADWPLQWEKNTSGTWTNVNQSPLDSYPFLNANTTTNFSTNLTVLAQSFLGDGNKLARARFSLGQSSGTGTVTAVLYAHSGTFGSGVGTGSILATSTNSYADTSLPITPGPLDFYFDETFTLAAGTPYFIGVQHTAASGIVLVESDTTTPTHPGNHAYILSSAWTTTANDLVFEVFTNLDPRTTVVGYASANLTDATNTTNRLGAGAGSLSFGRVSEDGQVEDFGWSANNYTELLYSVTLKQADLAPTDTLRFRVLRNGATSEFTYTQVPTVTIGAGGPTDRTGTATGSISLSSTAAGQKDVTATAAGSLTMSGAASGVITHDVPGTATGTLTLTGTASGSVAAAPVLGTATGTLTLGGTSVGTRGTPGTASGSLALTGTAVGAKTVTATAAGTLTVIGAAAGVKQASGVAVATITLSGTAAGGKTVSGTATGGLSIGGAASGLRVASGTATGSLALTGTATGQKTVAATASSSLTLAGTATGTKQVTGQATGQVVFSSTALGLVEGNAVGTATGTIGITGLAAGTRSTRGAATGSLGLTGTASGRRGTAATATGSLQLSGQATATKQVRGTATGTFTVVGTAAGTGPAVGFEIVGEWNDETVDAMQWGADTVVEWFMLVPTAVTGTATGTLTLSATAVGVAGAVGQATGTVTLSASAAGLAGAVGVATGTVSLSGSAVGVGETPATGLDVLFEDFANLTDAPWTAVHTTGNTTIVAGRTGNCARVQGNSGTDYIRYSLGANEADTVTVGFAYQPSVLNVRSPLWLYSDSNATEHTRLIMTATGALQFARTVNVLGTSAAATVAVGVWKYIEVQTRLGDSPNGFGIVRVDGVEVINTGAVDTKNAGTKTVYDTIRLGGGGSSASFGLFDDLYITVGAGAPFKGSITV